MNDPPDWDGGLEEEYKIIMQQAGCDRETAIKALDKTNGDMVASIMWIVEQENEKCSMIMRATGCDRETAVMALETNGNVEKSIMWVVEQKKYDSHN